MNTNAALLNFLKSQKFLIIGTQGSEPWIVNVFYGIDEDFTIYFVSGEEEKHSRHIIQNPAVTFSTVWFDANDHTDRKGIQGKGVCRVAESDAEIEKGISLHNQNFPEFKERLTPDYIRATDNKSHVWVIKPALIKFWNDELYGDDEWKEFTF